jgi:hypothetical protein
MSSTRCNVSTSSSHRVLTCPESATKETIGKQEPAGTLIDSVLITETERLRRANRRPPSPMQPARRPWDRRRPH